MATVKRIQQLDVLRCIAVLVVIVRHIGLGKENEGLRRFLGTIYHSETAWGAVGRSLLEAGWSGVDLFFVLSGFLVSGLLFREYEKRGDVRIGRFLIRRGFKIYPPFYFLLAISTGLILFTGAHHVSLSALLCEALFVQNYGPNLWGHTWSLAVEEHFYILLSLLVLVLSRRGGGNPFRWLPGIFVVVGTACLGLRIATAVLYPEFEYKTHIFPTHLRIDSLMFGVLISYYFHFSPKKVAGIMKRQGLLAVIAAVLIAPVFFLPQESVLMRTGGFTLLYVGFGALLLLSLSLPAGDGAISRNIFGLTGGIGRHSYSIYLWHLPVITMAVPLVMKVLHRRPSAGLEGGLYVVGALVCGIVMAKVIEFPALAVRDRYFPSRDPMRPVPEQEASAGDITQRAVVPGPSATI